MKQEPAVPRPAVRRLGLADYETVWRQMRDFTGRRRDDTADELWLVQHPPVYTLGLNCRMSPLRPTPIPIVHCDRGGQITYHGPGQVVAYPLIDVRRRSLGVRGLVNLLEQAVINVLEEYAIAGERRKGAPGVYVGGEKISALGVRIRRGGSYHGLSLNVDMDLAPFDDIDPCGYPGLRVTQLRDLGVTADLETIEDRLAGRLLDLLERH